MAVVMPTYSQNAFFDDLCKVAQMQKNRSYFSRNDLNNQCAGYW